ncbi:ABC transporter permease [Rhodococcus sp. AG1013]|uniref:ABC transporter permease n=1 Tax=unclassified Rhodococcus (in: high G+C Gram-positive bacteria) TaxID=192944 RepID=UPI000E0A7E27|nr:ABC transporter permease [Rhodococcus sp. AG1013]RDI35997.1 ABC-2 family transporter [Rhodococcus sp. AG1013]
MTTRLLTAEFRKVTSLRFWWALGLAPLLVGVMSSAISIPMFNAVADEVASKEANTAAAAIGLFVALGLVFLFSALFGAVNAGTEYRHNTLTTTFLTARGRDGVLAAKLAVTALFGLLYCLVIEVVSVPLLLALSDNFEIDGTIVGVLAIGLVASTLWALIGAGLALATGSSIASAVGLVVWYVMGEGIVRLVLAGLGADAVAQWLPGSVTVTAFVGTIDHSALDGMPGWPLSLLVLCLWAVASCGLGWWATRSRDIT